MNNVKLVWITPDAEKMMGYIARVSNTKNQDNPNVAGLLKYCANHGHWSVFEQANLCLEINTSRAISAQILRHRSFQFQEFSQRYAEVEDRGFVVYEARSQDDKNRQNSNDDMSEFDKETFRRFQQEIWIEANKRYKELLRNGVAKECARMLLPMNTSTKIYMNGTVRSWIHYIELRTGNGTQLEHMNIAKQAKSIFIEQLPIVSEALGWK